MKKKHLFWLLLPSYWVLTAVAIVVVAFYAFHSMSNLYFQALETDIHTRAILLSNQVAPLVKNTDAAAKNTSTMAKPTRLVDRGDRFRIATATRIDSTTPRTIEYQSGSLSR